MEGVRIKSREAFLWEEVVLTETGREKQSSSTSFCVAHLFASHSPTPQKIQLRNDTWLTKDFISNKN